MVGYTAKTDPATTSRALGTDLQISPKKAREVCKMLRGKNVDDAIDYLERVQDLTQPVPYTRYNKCVSHKRGVGPGGYPVKVSAAIQKIIEQAQANAEYKGLDTDGLKIHTISAHKGTPIRNYQSRAHGRSSPFFQDVVHIEVILEAVEE